MFELEIKNLKKMGDDGNLDGLLASDDDLEGELDEEEGEEDLSTEELAEEEEAEESEKTEY